MIGLYIAIPVIGIVLLIWFLKVTFPSEQDEIETMNNHSNYYYSSPISPYFPPIRYNTNHYINGFSTFIPGGVASANSAGQTLQQSQAQNIHQFQQQMAAQQAQQIINPSNAWNTFTNGTGYTLSQGTTQISRKLYLDLSTEYLKTSDKFYFYDYKKQEFLEFDTKQKYDEHLKNCNFENKFLDAINE